MSQYPIPVSSPTETLEDDPLQTHVDTTLSLSSIPFSGSTSGRGMGTESTSENHSSSLEDSNNYGDWPRFNNELGYGFDVEAGRNEARADESRVTRIASSWNWDVEDAFINSVTEGIERQLARNRVMDMYRHMMIAAVEESMEYGSGLRGNMPAAKRVVESLPFVEVSQEELKDGVVVCAVCTNELLEGEMVNRLPCCHYYHKDCILPWLKIRNTCPACRYELSTDDQKYESRKRMRGAGGI